MSGVDPTIQPGTLEEKYEIMKARKVADGSWNEDSELELRRVLGMGVEQAQVEEAGEVTPEAASTDVPVVARPRAKARVKKARK